MRRLAVHDVAQAQRAGAEHDADQREAESQLVADHLRAGAQRAQQGILVVRRPAGERNAVDADRGDTEDHQQADVEVGDLEQIDAVDSWMSGAERHHRDRESARRSAQ